MSGYSDGVRVERDARTDLRENGYRLMRAAGSKSDMGMDLYAIKKGDHLFVNVKKTQWPGPAERALLVDSAAWVGALAIVAEKVPGGLRYWRLIGTGPQDRVPFVLDEVAEGVGA